MIAAGISNIIIVTGHEADRMDQAVSDLARSFEQEIRTVRLDDWSRPNGWSVIAGAHQLEAPFLLVMADHLFGDGLLADLAAQNLDEAAVVLATDAPSNPLVDPDDATWVECDADHRIVQIAKGLDTYQAVDCGAFLADKRLPQAIEAAIAMGKAGSLSDGMQVLADQGQAVCRDVAGRWWIDVDDARALDLARDQAPDHIAWLEHAAPFTHPDTAYAS